MSHTDKFFAAFLLICFIFCTNAKAEVAVTSSSVEALTNVIVFDSSCSTNTTDQDNAEVFNTFTGNFNPTLISSVAVTGGSAITNLLPTVSLAQNGTASLSINSQNVFSSTLSGSCAGFTAGCTANVDVTLEVSITAESAQLQFSGNYTHAISGTDKAQASLTVENIGGNFFSESITAGCSNGSSCPAQSTAEGAFELPIGNYRIHVRDFIQNSGANAVDIQFSAFWSLDIGNSSCDIRWINPGLSDFGNASNWSTNTVPGNPSVGCDNLIFDIEGTTGGYGPFFNNQRTVNGVNVSKDLVKLGDPLLDTDSLIANGSFIIKDGGILDAFCSITAPFVVVGQTAGAESTLSLHAPMVSTDGIVVGDGGGGTLNIGPGNLTTIGATVGNNKPGAVVLQGTGVIWDARNGLFRMATTSSSVEQSSVFVLDEAILKSSESEIGFGVVTVEKVGSVWECENLTVGIGGGSNEGVISIRDEGRLDANSLILGGGSSSGTLNISSRGDADIAGNIEIGKASDGTATLDLGQLSSAIGDLNVGIKGNGLLELKNASLFQANNINIGIGSISGPVVGGSMVIGDLSFATARNNVFIGDQIAAGIATVRATGGLSGQSIKVGLLGKLFVESPGGNINPSIEITVDGEMRVLLPDSPNKQVTSPAQIDGNLVMGQEGKIIIEVGDPSSTALQVTGITTLSGALIVEISSGTVLSQGQVLQLIEFTGGVTGEFSSVNFPVAPTGFEGSVEVLDGVMRLTVLNPGNSTGEGEGEGEEEPRCGCRDDSGKSISPWTAFITHSLGDIILLISASIVLYAMRRIK